MPWPRRLVACLSPLRPGFDPRSVHVGFVVDRGDVPWLRRLVACLAEARVRSPVIPCGICGEQSGTMTDSPEYFSFPLSVSFQLGRCFRKIIESVTGVVGHTYVFMYVFSMYLCMYLVCIWFTGIAPADNEANKVMTSKLPCSSCKFYYQPLHKVIFMLLRVSATYYSHHQGTPTGTMVPVGVNSV